MNEGTKDLIGTLKEMEQAFINMSRHLRDCEPEISFKAFQISEVSAKAAEELKRNIPQKMETEGGGSSWWYVCPECHGAIDGADHYCKHCGQAVEE